MARLLAIVLILGGALFYVVMQIFKFFLGISGGRSALTKDQIRLEALLKQYELDPIELDELDIISHQFEEKERRRLFSTTRQGVYLSIYQEPIIAYASKSYHNSERRIVSIKIGSDIFHFNIKGKQATVFKGSIKIGTMSLSGRIELAINKENVTIDLPQFNNLHPILVNGRHVWSVDAKEDTKGQQGRILKNVNTHSKEEDQLVLLSLAYVLADKQI